VTDRVDEPCPRLAGMSTEEGASSTEDMKRKFREALEKKNAHHREGQAHLDGDSAVHGTHAPQTRREFRRKSG
jgi:hypothetical protein